MTRAPQHRGKYLKPDKPIIPIPDWFDPGKYDVFSRTAKGSHKKHLQLWCNALLLRQHLVREIEAGKIDGVADYISRLIRDPADSCGFSVKWKRGTLWPTNRDDLFFLKDEKWMSRLDKKNTIDDVYSSVASEYGAKAFLTVNLMAETEAIKADFSRWLTEARETRGVEVPHIAGASTLTQRWARYRLLAFIDIVHILAPYNHQQIAEGQAAKWLGLKQSDRTLEDLARKTLPSMVGIALSPAIIQYLTVSSTSVL